MTKEEIITELKQIEGLEFNPNDKKDVLAELLEKSKQEADSDQSSGDGDQQSPPDDTDQPYQGDSKKEDKESGDAVNSSGDDQDAGESGPVGSDESWDDLEVSIAQGMAILAAGDKQKELDLVIYNQAKEAGLTDEQIFLTDSLKECIAEQEQENRYRALWNRAKKLGLTDEQIKAYPDEASLKAQLDRISPQSNPDAKPKVGETKEPAKRKQEKVPDALEIHKDHLRDERQQIESVIRKLNIKHNTPKLKTVTKVIVYDCETHKVSGQYKIKQ